MTSRACGIITAILLAACIAHPARATRDVCATRIERVERLPGAVGEHGEGPGEGPGYRIVEGADTSFARAALPDADLNGDGDADLVLSLVGSEVPGGSMVGVYLRCGAGTYARALEPEYAYEVRLGAATAGRGRDLVWVERAGSNDPNSDYLSSHLLRLDGEAYARVAGSERILPTGAADCPADGPRFYLIGDAAPKVVPYDTASGRGGELPIPATESWRGDLNGDGVTDRIVALGGGGRAAETGVYAGCGGYAHVRVWSSAGAASVAPAATSTLHDGSRWRDLRLRQGASPPATLRFGGPGYLRRP